MLIDAHLDLAMNALYIDRDVTGSALETRAREGANPRCGNSTVGLADLRRGRFGMCFATVSVLAHRAWKPLGELNFKSIDEAHQQGRDQIAFYRSLEAAGHVRIITDAASLEAHLTAWNADP